MQLNCSVQRLKGSDGLTRQVTIPAARTPEHVRFTAISSDEGQVPGLEVRVELQLEGFSGGTTAWFSRHDLAEFMASLKRLEASRKGSARLPPESGPGDCQLELEALDKSGHVRVTTEIERTDYLGEEYRPTRLSGSFELDSECLLRLIDEMEALSRFRGSRRTSG